MESFHSLIRFFRVRRDDHDLANRLNVFQRKSGDAWGTTVPCEALLSGLGEGHSNSNTLIPGE